MYTDRQKIYERLEDMRGSKVLVYVTGDKPGFETQIAQDSIDHFISHLEHIGIVPKISLFLYTCGGDTLAAWNIVNLIKQYCDSFEVIIPHKARSAGTLMSIGAETIVMTKQATLGPIDPSINTPLNPQIPNAAPDAKYPVSVEDVLGYLEWAKAELNINNDIALSNILIKLTDQIHPLVLGQAYRAKAQIKMLARRMLNSQIDNEGQIQKVISFLCSESGSHDYTINRREARDILGLNVEVPSDELYSTINELYINIRDELALNTPFDPVATLGANKQQKYTVRRVLIESRGGGCDFFCSEGVLSAVSLAGSQAINDNRTFEGWKNEPHH